MTLPCAELERQPVRESRLPHLRAALPFLQRRQKLHCRWTLVPRSSISPWTRRPRADRNLLRLRRLLQRTGAEKVETTFSGPGPRRKEKVAGFAPALFPKGVYPSPHVDDPTGRSRPRRADLLVACHSLLVLFVGPSRLPRVDTPSIPGAKGFTVNGLSRALVQFRRRKGLSL